MTAFKVRILVSIVELFAVFCIISFGRNGFRKIERKRMASVI